MNSTFQMVHKMRGRLQQPEVQSSCPGETVAEVPLFLTTGKSSYVAFLCVAGKLGEGGEA